ncbi:MAG: hypothetical protein RIT45_3786 [Pseudomonadota bacterium]
MTRSVPPTAPSRRSIHRLGLLSFCSAFIMTASALAQPAPEPAGQPATGPAQPQVGPALDGTAGAPADPKDQAAAFDNEGRDHYRAGRYQEAFRAFEAAHRLDADPKYLYNMARAKEKLAKYQDAVELLERYLVDYRTRTGGDAPNRADVENLIRQLRQRAYEALPQVVIGSNPSGAVVQTLADGRTLGTTPLTTHLRPGVYKLRLQVADHQPLDADLVVPETGSVRAVFSLVRIVRLAALSFWCNIRQTKIAVDGKVVAVTPFSGRIEVPPGRHQVSLSREGYTTVEEIVDVPENKELHLDYVLDPLAARSSWRSFIGWPLAVFGFGGVGAGFAAGIQADEYYRGTPNFDRWAGMQQIGYGAGAASAAVGTALIVWDATRDNIPTADLAPGPRRERGRKLLPLEGADAPPGRPEVKR